jgi:hypothetical protein
LITPPNFRGGGGSCLPSIVIVALGEPGVPVICWAFAAGKTVALRRMPNDSIAETLFIVPLSLFASQRTNKSLVSHRKNRAKT